MRKSTTISPETESVSVMITCLLEPFLPMFIGHVIFDLLISVGHHSTFLTYKLFLLVALLLMSFYSKVSEHLVTVGSLHIYSSVLNLVVNMASQFFIVGKRDTTEWAFSLCVLVPHVLP